MAALQFRLLLNDTALAGVRDKPALAALAAHERRQWEALWGSVENVVAGGPVATLPTARAYAAQGECAVAADCYAWVFRTIPNDDGEAWFEFAAVSLLAGDRKVYRQTCAWMVDRAPGPRGEMRPYHVARACTLAPDAVSDIARPTRLSRSELQSSRKTFWSLTEQGALRYRAGEFREAIPLFEQSLAAVSSQLGAPCTTFAFPNGNYTTELAQHALRCGARTVMTTDPTWVDPHSAVWRLPRIQLFGESRRSRIELKIALAAVRGVLPNPDGSGRRYRNFAAEWSPRADEKRPDLINTSL